MTATLESLLSEAHTMDENHAGEGRRLLMDAIGRLGMASTCPHPHNVLEVVDEVIPLLAGAVGNLDFCLEALRKLAEYAEATDNGNKPDGTVMAKGGAA